MSSQKQEHAALWIGGDPFEVVSLSGSESISELFRYELTCSAHAEGRAMDALVGAEARIRLDDGLGAERTITGIVAEAEDRRLDHGRALLKIVVRPVAWVLALGRTSRVFQDLTARQIIDRVVSGAPGLGLGLPVRWELSSVYAPHVYCAQYREDDWSFVRRLIEEEGIYAWFDHTEGGTVLVFGDDSSRAPDLTGGARIDFAHETGMGRRVESVFELGRVARVAPKKFTVGSFNPAKPKLAVKGATGEGDLEIYEAEGGAPDSPDACARLARFMAESAAAGAKGARGASTSVRLVPGMVVAIEGHPLSSLDGRYLVVESSCSVTQRRRVAGGDSAEERPYVCRFRVVPAGLSFRLPRVTARGKQAGLQIGAVVGPPGAEVHPDASGRVRVRYHWDREGGHDDKAGKWMRVAQRGTGDSMLLPRIGWNVATFNEEGEIDAPAVLSRLHDAEHPPAYPLPENQTRVVFKTATTPGGGSFNEIYFEDKASAEEMFLHASKDMSVLVQNDRTERVSRDAERTIEHDHVLHVAGDYTDTVKRDQTVTIDHDETITVHGASTKMVTGDETNTIAGRRSVTAGGKHLDQVAKTRKLTVGTAQIDTTLGNIASTAAQTHILVGGALIRVTASAITESHGWVGIQTIGGAKLEMAAKARVVDVKKNYLETVGGGMALTAGGAYRDHAAKTSSWTVIGVASFSAPAIVFEAKERIQVKVGGAVVTLTADEVTITGPSFDLSQASSVVVNTPQASHN